MCTLYLRHRLTNWCTSATPNTHTEITSGSSSRNSGKKLGGEFTFFLCIILCCVGFYTENVFLFCLGLKTKGTDSILTGTRDIISRNTSIASHKELTDGIAPHITRSASELKLCPPGGTYYRFYATNSPPLYPFPLQVLAPPVHYCS